VPDERLGGDRPVGPIPLVRRPVGEWLLETTKDRKEPWVPSLKPLERHEIPESIHVLSILLGEVLTLEATMQRNQGTLDSTLCRKAEELVCVVQGLPLAEQAAVPEVTDGGDIKALGHEHPAFRQVSKNRTDSWRDLLTSHDSGQQEIDAPKTAAPGPWPPSGTIPRRS
jgi:hypothetical protein